MHFLYKLVQDNDFLVSTVGTDGLMLGQAIIWTIDRHATSIGSTFTMRNVHIFNLWNDVILK